MQFDLAELEIAAKMVKAKYPSMDAREAVEAFMNLLYQPQSKDKLHLFYKINKKLFEEPTI
jgi:hypothetical protein